MSVKANVGRFILYSFLLCTPFSMLQAKPDMLDLTYSYDKKTIYWPTEKGFDLKKVFYGKTPGGYFYSAYKFCAPEHGGTHMDAPRHFSASGYTVDKIPVFQLEGNAVVIRVDDKARNQQDYAITVEDIQHFEKQHHALGKNDIVLFYTGWGKYWGNKKRYLGSDKEGDVKNLHFPGISKEAAEYLVLRKVKGVGLDTASLDPGSSTTFWAHRVLLGANIYGLENVANLQLLPLTGSKLIVAPMKIKGGSGGPTRIFALTP